MKKYWKTIMIVLVIITTISFYYIQTALASNLSFTIQNISGNKEEVENLVIRANYEVDYSHQSLYISQNDYIDGMSPAPSFIEKLTDSYVPSMLRDYIEEYRHFMRGKELNPSLFFEDETSLIYADIPNYGQNVNEGESLTFQIEILDKYTYDSTSFEISTQAQANYDLVLVNDVYVKGGKIKILAMNFLSDAGEELHIYTVDEKNKELELDSLISKSEPGKKSNDRARVINDLSSLENEKYYLYEVRSYAQEQSGNENPGKWQRRTYVYNNSSEKAEELMIPQKLKPYRDAVILQGTEIFIPVPSENGLELNRYNLEKEQWEEPLIFKYQTNSSNEVPFLQLLDGKIYIVNTVSDGHLLLIADLRTGETLYEGKIIPENIESSDPVYSLYISEIYSLK